MAKLTTEKKQAKLFELANLIMQYDNGETENINIDEYPTWIKISTMLKDADIEESIYDDFLLNPSHYKISNSMIVYNENWENEELVAEQKRIAMLHITKYDFFKYICKPNNISYEQLTQLINSNEDLAAAWNLCSYVYRGDQTLNNYIFTNIENLTEETLTQIFEEHAVID